MIGEIRGFFFPAILFVIVQMVVQLIITLPEIIFPASLNYDTDLNVSGSTDTYRGAVVEYHPVKLSTDELTLEANVKNYIKLIQQASEKKADIIVFPESVLNGKIHHPIPDPVDDIVPCDSKDFQTTAAVRDLSCASKNNKIYTVVNLVEQRKCEPGDENCPSRGHYVFNTNVVFDRTGMVIARYSKYNLFDEKVDRLKEPEIVFFDTDFGVRFGTFICFDILFPTPTLQLYQQYGITDFVFTTNWFSEIPFLTALQVQRGWAESNNVNLLASGYNKPKLGSGGSGIYNGKYGYLVQTMPDEETTQLLVANIPKMNNDPESDLYSSKKSKLFEATKKTYNLTSFHPAVSEKLTEEEKSELVLLKDQMHLFSSEVISHDKEKFDKQICTHKGFCCDFHVVKDTLGERSKNYTVRVVALNRVRKFGISFSGGAQACAVLVCEGPEIMDCAKRVKNLPGLFKFKEITIKGNFKAKNSLQIPTTLSVDNELTPLPANKYEFTKSEGNTSLELLWPMIDLQVFGIWGRDFTRDMEPEVPESKASDALSMPLLLIAFLGFVLFAR